MIICVVAEGLRWHLYDCFLANLQMLLQAKKIKHGEQSSTKPRKKEKRRRKPARGFSIKKTLNRERYEFGRFGVGLRTQRRRLPLRPMTRGRQPWYCENPKLKRAPGARLPRFRAFQQAEGSCGSHQLPEPSTTLGRATSHGVLL